MRFFLNIRTSFLFFINIKNMFLRYFSYWTENIRNNH